MTFSAPLFKKDLLNFLLSKYKNFWLRIYFLFFLPVIFESYLDFSLLCVPSRSLCVHKAKSMWDYAIHMCFKCLQTEFSVPKSNCVVQYWLCFLCSTSPEFRLVQVWFLACPFVLCRMEHSVEILRYLTIFFHEVESERSFAV